MLSIISIREIILFNLKYWLEYIKIQPNYFAEQFKLYSAELGPKRPKTLSENFSVASPAHWHTER